LIHIDKILGTKKEENKEETKGSDEETPQQKWEEEIYSE